MHLSEDARKVSKVRVLVVDESSTARQRLREDIQQASWAEVVAEAGNCQEAMTLFFRLKPDVLVLPISIGYKGGFQVLRSIRRASFNCTTILTSGQSNPFITDTGLLLGGAAVCCVSQGCNELLSVLQQYLTQPTSQRA
jgi:two-component system chemotaxis response regulator CheY